MRAVASPDRVGICAPLRGFDDEWRVTKSGKNRTLSEDGEDAPSASRKPSRVAVRSRFNHLLGQCAQSVSFWCISMNVNSARICSLIALLLVMGLLVSARAGGLALCGAMCAWTEENPQRSVNPVDAQARGSPPFRLVARVFAFGNQGQATEGGYGLLWRSPASWRDELRFSGFSQIRVAAGDKLYLSRNHPSLTPEIFLLLNLVNFLRTLSSGAQSTATAEKLPASEESKAWSDQLRERVDIVGEFSLTDVIRIPLHWDLKKRPSEFQFDRYLDFQGRHIPGVLTQLDSGKPFVRVEVKEIATAAPDDSSFDPPKDAFPLPWCPNPRPATLQGIWGGEWLATLAPPKKGFAVYGIIGTEGKWHNLTVVRSSGEPDVEKVYLDHTVTRDLYYPAACGKQKVVEEQVIEFLPAK